MNRSKLPHALALWLEDRGFNYEIPEKADYLNDDEVYSAAHELWGDLRDGDNLWCIETPSWEKAQVKRFINQHSDLKVLPLAEWYSKGH